MKTVNKIATGALALMAVLFLDACSKTKNSTPSTSNTTAICPANGMYQVSTGQMQQCMPGSTVNTAYPVGYNGNNYPQGVSTCQDATNYYRVQYVPVNNPQTGMIDCVKYSWLQQYAQGSSYGNYGPDFYYYNPPEFSYASNGGQYIPDVGGYVNFNLNLNF